MIWVALNVKSLWGTDHLLKHRLGSGLIRVPHERHPASGSIIMLGYRSCLETQNKTLKDPSPVLFLKTAWSNMFYELYFNVFFFLIDIYKDYIALQINELLYLLLWTKILASLHFFQIMHRSFQKIVEIKKYFGLHMCIYLVCSGTKQKKLKKMINLSSFHTKIIKWPRLYYWHLSEFVWNN